MPLPLSSETTIVRSMIFEVSALKNVEYIYRSHQTILVPALAQYNCRRF